jgi:hypothetical protein
MFQKNVATNGQSASYHRFENALPGVMTIPAPMATNHIRERVQAGEVPRGRALLYESLIPAVIFADNPSQSAARVSETSDKRKVPPQCAYGAVSSMSVPAILRH